MDRLTELKQWRDSYLERTKMDTSSKSLIFWQQQADLLTWCIQQIDKQTSICPDCFYGPSCECADNETQSCNKFIAKQIERPADVTVQLALGEILDVLNSDDGYCLKLVKIRSLLEAVTVPSLVRYGELPQAVTAVTDSAVQDAIETLEEIYPSKKQIVTGEYPHVAEALDLAIAALQAYVKPTDRAVQDAIEFVENLAESCAPEWRNAQSKKVGCDLSTEEIRLSLAIAALRQYREPPKALTAKPSEPCQYCGCFRISEYEHFCRVCGRKLEGV